MAERSAIEWCDSTFNPWIGCTKVSPACDHCYAEAQMDTRMQRVKWGAGQPRARTSAANWRKPLQWNARSFWECGECGWRGEQADWSECPACKSNSGLAPARRRVFCASLADVFDNEVPVQWRLDLFDLISATPSIDWLLLTKRIGNAAGMLDQAASSVENDFVGAPTWARAPWPNVWLGATICNQAEADRDIPKLLATPAAVRFVSIEPMLGRVDLTTIRENGWHRFDGLRGLSIHDQTPYTDPSSTSTCRVDWVIAGGESGPHARPAHPDWFRSLRDQCAAAGVPFLFKQWGEWRPPLEAEQYSTAMGRAQRVPCFIVAPAGTVHCFENGEWTAGGQVMRRIGKKAAGRLLDGVEHNGFAEITGMQERV